MNLIQCLLESGVTPAKTALIFQRRFLTIFVPKAKTNVRVAEAAWVWTLHILVRGRLADRIIPIIWFVSVQRVTVSMMHSTAFQLSS